ncbi:hypothetical protein [Actinoplanes sp. NPDC026670]|uniref:hypothetical protein n=1 Tax=Actinoplanes sp. NPDC026670 TaxID=3154700 RepID=UPI0033FA363A
MLGLLLIVLMFASAVHSLRGFLRYRRDQKDRREVAALTTPVPDSGKASVGAPDKAPASDAAPASVSGKAAASGSGLSGEAPASGFDRIGKPAASGSDVEGKPGISGMSAASDAAASDSKAAKAVPSVDKSVKSASPVPGTSTESASPESAPSGSASPGSASPGSASPGSASPGSASPGSASPGSASSGSASPESASTSSGSGQKTEAAAFAAPSVGNTDRSSASISPAGRAAASATPASGQKSETAVADGLTLSQGGKTDKPTTPASVESDQKGGKGETSASGKAATPFGTEDSAVGSGDGKGSTAGAGEKGSTAAASGKGSAATDGGKGSAASASGKGSAAAGGRTDTAVQPAVELAGTDVLESPPRKKLGWLRFFRRPAPAPKKPPRWKPLIGVLLTNVNIMGATIFAAVGILIAVPYIRLNDSGSRLEEIQFFSPPLQGLLIGPAESRIWGAAHETPRSTLGWAAEMSLLPGFVLYALALAGLFLSIWRLRHRLVLLAGLATAVVLTLGTNFLDGRWTYLPLFGHFPASFDLRIPGRLMLWVTLVLSILAAGAVDDFVRRAEHLAAQRIPPWPGPWLRLATLVPLLLVALEGWNTTAHPIVPAQPAAMRTVPGPMLVLPTAELTDQTVQLWSTTKFQDMANGGGGFGAQAQSELRAKVAGFPDATSINYLDSIGVRRVLLLSDHIAGTSWEGAGDLPVDNLDIRREDIPGAVVFYLD